MPPTVESPARPGEFGRQRHRYPREIGSQRFYIPSLDGLRAVSILIVFVAHAGLDQVPGGFGVTIFFFLSGYLITTLLRREYEADGSIRLKQFYWRRAWRILPPMYVALTVGVLASLLDFTLGEITVPAVTLQALQLSNYAQLIGFGAEIPLGTGIMWSLAIEEHFYLVFPIALVFMFRRLAPSGRALALLGTCGVILAWRMVLVGIFDVSIDRTYLATDTRVDAILFGCILGLYLNPMLDDGPRPSPRVASQVTVAAVAVIGLSMLYREPFYRETIRYTVQSVALAPIFYLAVQQPTLWCFKPLNVGWVRFIGVLSYSFYLLHHIVVLTFKNHFPDLPIIVAMVVTGAISLGLSYLSYLMVEQPALALRKRFGPAPAPV